MITKLTRKFAILAAISMVAVTANAGEIWFSPLTAIPVGPSAAPSKLVVKPGVPTTGIVVTSATTVAATDYQWVNLGLTVSAGTVIKAVKIGYQVASQAEIAQIRLTEMKAPNVAWVAHDAAVNLTSTSPVMYETPLFTVGAQGTVTLSFKVILPSLTSSVKIGGIALVTQ